MLLAAGDTFRAAAIEQLKVWAERSGAEFAAQLPGADPGAVVFDALQAARARGSEVLLADAYLCLAAVSDTGLGPGWAQTGLASAIELESGEVLILRQDGRQDLFRKPKAATTPLGRDGHAQRSKAPSG